MAKFRPAEAAKSLSNGITLVERGNKFKWVQFDEIEAALEDGFVILNEIKSSLYEKLRKKCGSAKKNK
jgi:hypothetical protein